MNREKSEGVYQACTLRVPCVPSDPREIRLSGSQGASGAMQFLKGETHHHHHHRPTKGLQRLLPVPLRASKGFAKMAPWRLTEGLQDHGRSLRSPVKSLCLSKRTITNPVLLNATPSPIGKAIGATIFIIFCNRIRGLAKSPLPWLPQPLIPPP